jgi:hypothetical protein
VTLAEYLAFEEASDEKHEWINGDDGGQRDD